jgi:ribosomal protein L33
MKVQCDICGGTGWIKSILGQTSCWTCGGMGYIETWTDTTAKDTIEYKYCPTCGQRIKETSKG